MDIGGGKEPLLLGLRIFTRPKDVHIYVLSLEIQIEAPPKKSRRPAKH